MKRELTLMVINIIISDDTVQISETKDGIKEKWKWNAEDTK